MRHVAVTEGGEGQRLDNWLLRELKGVPKTHVYRIVRSGEVRVNGARAQAQTRLQVGDQVRLPPVRTARRDVPAQAAIGAGVAPPASASPSAPPREFPVLYEDDWLLAIAKPAGVAVHGGSGVAFGVIEQLRRARPDAPMLELVHRLDRETSGVLLVAKRRRALTALQEQFRQAVGERVLRKSYVALVRGTWPARRKVLDCALVRTTGPDGERHVRIARDGDDAPLRSITLVDASEPIGPYTLLDIGLRTGRTHQIRVHLASEGASAGTPDGGHPILGDDRYGDYALNRRLARQGVDGVRLERMFLHARALRFQHPATGAVLTVQAPLPDDCARFLDALRARADAGGADPTP